MQIKVYEDDCTERMKDIPPKSIDMILCDLPYGVLNKKNPNARWDSVIPFEKLWAEYERIIKDNGAIVLSGSGMFTANLMYSNKKLWRYNLIWKKGNRVSGFLNAKKQPLRNHEDICVFYKKQPTYNPQFSKGEKCHTRNIAEKQGKNGCYGSFNQTEIVLTNDKYPISVIDIAKEHPQTFHSSQKPIALLEYLIKTYTNKNETVLDNCAGSMSTAIACINTQRNGIMIEKNKYYFEIGIQRILKHISNKEIKASSKIINSNYLLLDVPKNQSEYSQLNFFEKVK